MLGILVSYASFHQFELLQRENIRKFVKCPYKLFLLKTEKHPDPSRGHTESLNALLNQAWESCDSFLFFDNDMIFLNDFYEPEEDCWYWGQDREGFEYAWPNLLYFKKHPLMRSIDFENNSDAGGSTWRYLKEIENKKKIKLDKEGLEAYQQDVIALGNKYGVGQWSERYWINDTAIFHFRAMSNWTRYPADYIKEKEKLILHYVSLHNDGWTILLSDPNQTHDKN